MADTPLLSGQAPTPYVSLLPTLPEYERYVPNVPSAFSACAPSSDSEIGKWMKQRALKQHSHPLQFHGDPSFLAESVVPETILPQPTVRCSWINIRGKNVEDVSLTCTENRLVIYGASEKQLVFDGKERYADAVEFSGVSHLTSQHSLAYATMHKKYHCAIPLCNVVDTEVDIKDTTATSLMRNPLALSLIIAILAAEVILLFFHPDWPFATTVYLGIILACFLAFVHGRASDVSREGVFAPTVLLGAVFVHAAYGIAICSWQVNNNPDDVVKIALALRVLEFFLAYVISMSRIEFPTERLPRDPGMSRWTYLKNLMFGGERGPRRNRTVIVDVKNGINAASATTYNRVLEIYYLDHRANPEISLSDHSSTIWNRLFGIRSVQPKRVYCMLHPEVNPNDLALLLRILANQGNTFFGDHPMAKYKAPLLASHQPPQYGAPDHHPAIHAVNAPQYSLPVATEAIRDFMNATSVKDEPETAGEYEPPQQQGVGGDRMYDGPQ